MAAHPAASIAISTEGIAKGKATGDSTMKTAHKKRLDLARLAGATALVATLAGGAAEAQDAALKLGMGANYSTGDYGTGQDVDIWYVPFAANFETGRWNMGLTVPYISITSAGDVVGGTDAPIVTKKKKTKTTGGVVDRTTESGLGDVVGSVGYALLSGNDGMPFVELTGKVKFPTASESESLGTGEFDYTAQLDLAQAFGKVTPFATLGYRIIGDAPGTDLDNIFLASAGAVYAFNDQLSAGAALDYRQATTSSADDSVEFSPYVSWGLSDHLALDFYGLLGFSDGSPDIGSGLQLTITF